VTKVTKGPMTATAHMPLLERLRKGANCVVFLDGAPDPAADVADMLRKAADKIEGHQSALRFIADLADEEHANSRVGTGAEVALRHIARKAREHLVE